ncbi:capsular polysaccharide biosynthesis protein [Halomonas sp. KAO]|uniref:capsular polysaccharide biosynthesis protein n=1 Tax=Halomonas sp. KAO TaxID=2783858 RepID=UPI00189C6EBA|nr:capsular polysaccharide biosynthesis protein [Halomonas sp. KAO]MBF7052359.1 capsular polysaccharide biosynthesis protein [Halomonas sp. KAO]
MPPLTAACATPGIRRLAILPACLGEFQRFSRLRPWQRPDAVLGWGLKPTSRKARQFAARRGIPYVSLEDGFLRSWGLGVSGHQPHSLVVDHAGIYYDATRPSDLENLILEAPFDAEELGRARYCMALLRHYRLTKYNHAPLQPLPPADRPRVLVVDQTAGDASIEFGLADAATFETMLQVALDEHPQADILVKVHPDVIAEKKRGHLLEAARKHPRCQLLGDDLNPWGLLDAVDCVHVVTSQLGFEALLAGRRVVCHGMPFYAGWGVTDDRLGCERRGQSRTLEQLFAAAYLRYCRYANPYTGEPSTLEATIDLIADQRRRQAQLAGEWVGIGFSSWKRGFVGDFLGGCASLRHARSVSHADPAPQEHLLVWSSDRQTHQKLARHQALPRPWRMEDGFIRSVGLGVDLVRPLSLVIDGSGIHYDPSRPSDLETLLEESEFSVHLLARARRLRERIVALGLSKYNVGDQDHGLSLPQDKHILLIVGQVESDASARLGAPNIATNAELIRRVRVAHPDAYLLYKPHPDVVSGARVGQLDAQAKQLYDCLLTDISITALLDRVDELHTMSSLAGFEALLRGCPVTTWGVPFYAGWGLTRHRGPTCPRRTRRLTLDELVAGCLIRYPTYVEPRTRRLVNVETVVGLLEQQRRTTGAPSLPHRLYRWYRNHFIGRH